MNKRSILHNFSKIDRFVLCVISKVYPTTLSEKFI
ncbi:hypothetical protein HD_0087 [[Haemophilus] ducreyi 35000HP]|uniref:Uncharacterized protein n=1 Tax=Haemophilus ducreyi (strain 35000HP / ATCC 700724) TaxID=233412 RepID=Q7VPI6_HAEDU|nr:hypothetical protein HD_0087 [[Haemophilus] ducreyi 35000HP]